MSHSPFTCRADVAYDVKVRLRQRSLCDGPAVDLVLLDMYLPDGGAAGLPKGLAPERLHEAIAQLREPPGVWSARELAERLGSSRVTARRYLEYFVEVGMVVRSLRYSGGGRPEVEYRCEHIEGDADRVAPPR
jgi:response regulator of citrate/malate metabolism